MHHSNLLSDCRVDRTVYFLVESKDKNNGVYYE